MNMRLGGQGGNLPPSPEEQEFRRKLNLLADSNKKVSCTVSGDIVETNTWNVAANALNKLRAGTDSQLELSVMLLLTEGKKWLREEDNAAVSSIAKRMNLIKGVNHAPLNDLIKMISDKQLHQEREYDKVLRKFVTLHESTLSAPLSTRSRLNLKISNVVGYLFSKSSGEVISLRIALDIRRAQKLIPDHQLTSQVVRDLEAIFGRYMRADQFKLRQNLLDNLRTIPEEFRAQVISEVAKMSNPYWSSHRIYQDSNMLELFSLIPKEDYSKESISVIASSFSETISEYPKPSETLISGSLDKIKEMPANNRILFLNRMLLSYTLTSPRNNLNRSVYDSIINSLPDKLITTFLNKLKNVNGDERSKFVNVFALIPNKDKKKFLEQATPLSWKVGPELVSKMAPDRRINLIYMDQLYAYSTWEANKDVPVPVDIKPENAGIITRNLNDLDSDFIANNLPKLSKIHPNSRDAFLSEISSYPLEEQSELFDIANRVNVIDSTWGVPYKSFHLYISFLIDIPAGQRMAALETELRLQAEVKKEQGFYIKGLAALPPTLRNNEETTRLLTSVNDATTLLRDPNVQKGSHDYIDQNLEESVKQNKIDRSFLKNVFNHPERYNIERTDERFQKICNLLVKGERLAMHKDPLNDQQWDTLALRVAHKIPPMNWEEAKYDIFVVTDTCLFFPPDIKDLWFEVAFEERSPVIFLKNIYAPRKQEVIDYLKSQLLEFWMGRNLNRKAGFEFSESILNNADRFGFFDAQDANENVYDSLHMLAQGVNFITDESTPNSKGNPYTMLETLKTALANEKPFTLEEMDIVPSANQVNPLVVRDLAGKSVGFVAGDFPESVKPGDFQKIFNDMNRRLSALPKEEQDKAGKEMAAQNHKGRTHLEIEKYIPGYLKSLIDDQAKGMKPDEPVDSSYIYFGSIMKMISEKSDEIPPGSYFSEKETAFLKFVSFIDECLIGQKDGLFAYYNLPEMAKYRKDPNAKAGAGFNDRVGKLVNSAVQDSLNDIIANNDFLGHFIKSNLPSTRAHQTLYVKNRCASQIGLIGHRLTFEPYSAYVRNELLDADPKVMVHEIFKRLDAKKLIADLRVVLKAATKYVPGERPSETFADLHAFFNGIPGKQPEEGWENLYFVMEDDMPAGVTELGAKAILSALGYISPIDFLVEGENVKRAKEGNLPLVRSEFENLQMDQEVYILNEAGNGLVKGTVEGLSKDAAQIKFINSAGESVTKNFVDIYEEIPPPPPPEEEG